MRDTLLTASVAALIGIFAASLHGQAPNATTAAAAGAWRGKGLTDVQGIKVGHFTLSERPTGCTAILAQDGTTGGVDVRGGAPGTRETDLLSPQNTVQIVNAITLSGGSAYGLDAAQGVMRWLEEHNIGYKVGAGVVPIVPAAILMDLGFGGDWKIRPTADCGYKAAAAASDGPVAEGNVGAGTGATVGKMGQNRSMKGGLGSASIALPDGLVVAALVAVNAVGDVIDPATGNVVAGVRTDDGKGLADARTLLRSGALLRRAQPRSGENTTIGVVATNARLDKRECLLVSQAAHDGMARALEPVHTTVDGDAIVAAATGSVEAPLEQVRLLAARVVEQAIRSAVSSPGRQ